MFESGLEFLRADFHLHTQKDKEFSYSGEPNEFVKSYISALKQANISVGVITNHNKFDKDEYKALKRAASKEKIFILPGVELTVKEGANGIHTLIVFNPDEWLENGNNHIQTFLTAAFATISFNDLGSDPSIRAGIYPKQRLNLFILSLVLDFCIPKTRFLNGASPESDSKRPPPHSLNKPLP